MCFRRSLIIEVLMPGSYDKVVQTLSPHKKPWIKTVNEVGRRETGQEGGKEDGKLDSKWWKSQDTLLKEKTIQTLRINQNILSVQKVKILLMQNGSFQNNTYVRLMDGNYSCINVLITFMLQFGTFNLHTTGWIHPQGSVKCFLKGQVHPKNKKLFCLLLSCFKTSPTAAMGTSR